MTTLSQKQIALNKLQQWIEEFDLSPQHTTAMPELIAILRQIIPDDFGWDGILSVINSH